MTQRYTVGMSVDRKAEHVTVEAEDALIAALKAKHQNPAAVITTIKAMESQCRVAGGVAKIHSPAAQGFQCPVVVLILVTSCAGVG